MKHFVVCSKTQKHRLTQCIFLGSGSLCSIMSVCKCVTVKCLFVTLPAWSSNSSVCYIPYIPLYLVAVYVKIYKQASVIFVTKASSTLFKLDSKSTLFAFGPSGMKQPWHHNWTSHDLKNNNGLEWASTQREKHVKGGCDAKLCR